MEYPILKDLLIAVGLIFFSLLAYHIVKRYLSNLVRLVFSRTKNHWDDILYEAGTFNGLPAVIPAIILYQGVEFFPPITDIAQRVIAVWFVIIATQFVSRLLSGILQIYNTYPISAKKPINSYLQIIRITVVIAAGIIIFSTLVGQSVWSILGGLGAITAVLMLMFQDTILGFIASIQISSNDLVRVGDWVEVSGYNADGDVIEVGLHHIKVRNWDKTVTVIPSHKFVSNAFKNWRGMFDTGGRRIKRSIYIDQSSVKFCTAEMLEKYRRIDLLHDYIDAKEAEIAAYNEKNNIDPDVVVNGRRMTNLGTFRAYLSQYLKNHPGLHQELLMLVRHMQPTREGIPLEIYAFTNNTAWVVYEGIQADIFDHIFAVVSEFDLRIAQNPTGNDLKELSNAQVHDPKAG